MELPLRWIRLTGCDSVFFVRPASAGRFPFGSSGLMSLRVNWMREGRVPAALGPFRISGGFSTRQRRTTIPSWSNAPGSMESTQEGAEYTGFHAVLRRCPRLAMGRTFGAGVRRQIRSRSLASRSVSRSMYAQSGGIFFPPFGGCRPNLRRLPFPGDGFRGPMWRSGDAS